VELEVAGRARSRRRRGGRGRRLAPWRPPAVSSTRAASMAMGTGHRRPRRARPAATLWRSPGRRQAGAPAGEAADRHVTEPSKIIPYYCLSLSTWPLSNHKELFCRFRRVKPGKSLTTGSRYALSPHEGGTRIQHYII
jgi:hypothetical protein